MVSINYVHRLVFTSLLVLTIGIHYVNAQTPQNTTYLGLGAGSLSFFGDVANQNSGFSPSLGRLGYNLSLSNELTPYLHGGLEAMFGTVAASERTLNRDLNFHSELRTGGLFVAYNFNHFLDEDRTVSPIISFGISGFEFLSKSDLKDSEGRIYHYWDDGTIRDIAQDALNSTDAILLTRDYTYESDLRELNLDGLGDYKETGFAFPIGIGAEFKMGDYLSLNIHTRYYLTTTDLIDNVSDQSVENRKGDSQNDRFLYTGFIVRYGLHKKVDRPDGPSGDLLADLNDRSDEDDDKVLDIVDQCPHTPIGVQVDVNGCPIDSDGDGVPDYLDLEMDTVEGAYVDENGVTLTDEEIERRYKRFMGVGVTNRVVGTVESADIPEFIFTPRPGKKYMVKVNETEEGISAELAALLLSIPDVQTIGMGDTTLYVVGDYDNLPDAVRRQLSLVEQGLDGVVISNDDGVIVDEDKATRQIKRDLKKEGFDVTTMAPDNEAVFWRIQVGAFRYKMSSNIFASLKDVVEIYGEDGLTRYFSGIYDSREDAETYREILHESGFNDAFLAAFREGEKISVAKARSSTDSATSEDLWDRASPNAFDEELIVYKIMLVESFGTIDTEKLEQLREVGSVEQITTPDRTVYLTGKFTDMSEAEHLLEQLHVSGLKQASIVGIFNGEIISLEEIDSMKEH